LCKGGKSKQISFVGRRRLLIVFEYFARNFNWLCLCYSLDNFVVNTGCLIVCLICFAFADLNLPARHIAPVRPSVPAVRISSHCPPIIIIRIIRSIIWACECPTCMMSSRNRCHLIVPSGHRIFHSTLADIPINCWLKVAPLFTGPWIPLANLFR